MGHDSKGQDTAWLLQGVELAHLARGIRYTWRAAAWLNAQSDCSRAFKAAQAQQGTLQLAGTAVAGTCAYQLEVQTSDVEGAGTSARMFIQLSGVQCEAGAVQLLPGEDSAATAAAVPSRWVLAGTWHTLQQGLRVS